jgi:hypothetical protein
MNEPVDKIHCAIRVEEPICYRRILKVLIQGKHVDTKNQQVHPDFLINICPQIKIQTHLIPKPTPNIESSTVSSTSFPWIATIVLAVPKDARMEIESRRKMVSLMRNAGLPDGGLSGAGWESPGEGGRGCDIGEVSHL